ncbi:unnamed protein product [Diabrotica balteata]|uniref:Uncharacterized protein n=1 Tax=Diabrotica balteata TaxID=107213 RepID=A0A9N9SVI4_DIABA|nr:unnamed protein product [Diabrotica balteata]
MRGVLIFMCVIVTISALSDKQIAQEWIKFKENHNKVYLNIVEEKTRFEHFKTNLYKIHSHNKKYAQGEVSWYMKVNQFADFSQAEFKHRLNLQKSMRPVATNVTYYRFPSGLHAPNAIDWRQQNAVREVKNQGNCGDCWAFSATGSLEGQFALKRNNPVSLSEQQLLDCSSSYGNGNCDEGGSMGLAFDYIRDNGIMATDAYPYEGQQSYCRYDSNRIVGKISGQVHVERLNEWALVEAVGTLGPISVGVHADFDFYGGGVFDKQGCPNGDGDLNHGMLAVGYGNENGVDYWIVKNSWGQEWGEQGFIRMRRGINLCGIAIDPLYPVL